MSLVTTQLNANTPVDIGQVLQCYLLPAAIGLNTTIAGNGNVVSNAIINNGFKNFAFCLKSTQAGSVSIQRYLDQAATIPVGAAITGSLVANTALTVDSVDSIPYQSMIITVSDSSGTGATISNCALLFQAQ
jgi:hypothetical protein